MVEQLPMSLGAAEAAAIVAAESNRLFSSCESAPDAAVAACPGWTTTDLAIHVSGVHRRVAHWCSIRAEHPERWPDPEPADPSAPWGWCRAGVELVTEALESIGSDEAVWTWTDRSNGGFYHRRMVHETVMHRFDAEAAAASPGPIDASIAADGIDELLHVGMRFRGDGSAIAYPEGSATLHATDTGHRWTLAANRDSFTPTRSDSDSGADTDATVSGTAEAVLLYLWGRPGSVEIDGDVVTASAWAAVAP